MNESILKIHTGTKPGDLRIGNTVIPCAVLENGTRVISETGLTNALLGTRSGFSRRKRLTSLERGTPVPLFLAPGNLKPFISEELFEGPLKPIKYQSSRVVTAFDASVLPLVCEIWLKAREAGALQEGQLDKAKKAEILMRGLAHIGITALVDEATGYQEIRDKNALQEILDKYLLKEFAAWAKRFPDEFYKQMFRLRGWQWRGMKVNRPSVVGKYTNDLVYQRLAPGVLEELQRRNPRDDKGNREGKHHQLLTPDLGLPALQNHLFATTKFMEASATWDQFYRSMQRAFPKLNSNMVLNFPEPENQQEA
jgi:P63C domain